MDNALFQTLAGFLKENSGLALTPDKTYLVDSRLQPVAEMHGLTTVAALIQKLPMGGTSAQLKKDVVEAMTTNETSFFRDNTPFETFRNYVLPNLLERRKAKRSLRILCAAASTGQEPYSLALVLAENAARLAGWKVEILGVDLDTRVLDRATKATYSQFEVQRGLPVQMLMKHFVQGENQTWQLKPDIRQMVTFRQRNLLHPIADLGRFDVVFCRNVLIYFDPVTKKMVLERIADLLPADGFLFLGGAETVINITERFATARDYRGVYGPRVEAAVPRVALA